MTSAPRALEQRARRGSLERELSQRPTGRLGRLLRPAERAGHQVSTAHFQAAYPAVAEAGLGAAGRLHRLGPARRVLRL